MPELPGGAPQDMPDLDAFRFWKPEFQERALELLQEREASTWKPFYCPNPRCDGKPHDTWDFSHARMDQRPPKWSGDWLVWLLAGGRGSGKTRTGSEVTHKVAKKVGRIILIAPTGPDFRDTMVEGISGILATSAPGQMPKWEPSKKRLTWPNGCIGQGFSAEEPDRLRGPQGGFVWGDEPAHWPLVDLVWDNMLFGLRNKGELPPKIVATSTPKPTKWLKNLITDRRTVTHRVSTYENLDNLASTFRDTILERYEGTRIGRQELHGELLEDVEGALWAWEMFSWVDDAPALDRIVVSVDPAGTANPKSDETGIIVLGVSGKNLYILADLTGRYTPEQWGSKCWAAVDDYSADAIVYERNYGGEMVRSNLDNTRREDVSARLIPVTSRRGKAIRAEPIVALYERNKIFHVGPRGSLAELEEEQTTWVPGEGASPNRVDALVHGATELGRIAMPMNIASPVDLNTYRTRRGWGAA